MTPQGANQSVLYVPLCCHLSSHGRSGPSPLTTGFSVAVKVAFHSRLSSPLTLYIHQQVVPSQVVALRCSILGERNTCWSSDDRSDQPRVGFPAVGKGARVECLCSRMNASPSILQRRQGKHFFKKPCQLLFGTRRVRATDQTVPAASFGMCCSVRSTITLAPLPVGAPRCKKPNRHPATQN